MWKSTEYMCDKRAMVMGWWAHLMSTFRLGATEFGFTELQTYWVYCVCHSQSVVGHGLKVNIAIISESHFTRQTKMKQNENPRKVRWTFKNGQNHYPSTHHLTDKFTRRIAAISANSKGLKFTEILEWLHRASSSSLKYKRNAKPVPWQFFVCFFFFFFFFYLCWWQLLIFLLFVYLIWLWVWFFWNPLVSALDVLWIIDYYQHT